MLSFYRKYYLQIKKSNIVNKEEKLKKIEEIANIYKLNPHFGGLEGQNGICHECHLEKARIGHWNCEECAGQIKSGHKKLLTIPEIQKKLEQWRKDGTLTCKEAEQMYLL